MSEKQTFKARQEKHENSEATGIRVPFDVEKVFGAKRVPVKVWINGVEHRSTVVRMGGEFTMAVPKKFRDATGIKAGEAIEVEMQRDREERIITPPEYLAQALSENPAARAAWEKLSFTQKKRTRAGDRRSEKTGNQSAKNH